MDTFMLILKTPSLHGNKSECGAKKVNTKVSTDFICNQFAWIKCYIEECPFMTVIIVQANIKSYRNWIFSLS